MAIYDGITTLDEVVRACAAARTRTRRRSGPCRPFTLARAGANVVVTARRQDMIDQTAAMLRRTLGECHRPALQFHVVDACVSELDANHERASRVRRKWRSSVSAATKRMVATTADAMHQRHHAWITYSSMYDR
mgnify:CR=1 FL=1